MSRTSDLQIGDKVQVMAKPYTGKEWIGAQGIIKNILEMSWGRDENTTVELELTTPVISEWETWPVGKLVNVPIFKLELVEAAPPVWKVGDLVEFWDEGNDHWQGGRGKVVSTPETNGTEFVRVQFTERIPLNELYKVGDIAGEYPKNLRIPKDLKHIEPEKTCKVGFDWCDCALEEEAIKSSDGTLAVVDEALPEAVNHPAHYGGDTTYEVIKVAEAWGLDKDAYLFNVLKYVARAGKKGSKQEDLEKADFYIKRRIDNPLEEAK